MRIEKLNDNKIRIFFNIDDLKEKNINLHSFMSNSSEYQDVFFDMLEKAEEEFGFVTKDYRLIIEALATSDGNFIVTVTRVIPEKNNIKLSSNVKAKRKYVSFNNKTYIYSFNNFEDFCEFCNYLKNYKIKGISTILKNSSLYLYNSVYYFCIQSYSENEKPIKSITCALSEFGTYIEAPNLFERKLTEYGKVIFKKNAVNLCTKHFN